MYFGFELSGENVREFSPKLFEYLPLHVRRVFFITLYNSCVDREYKLPLHVEKSQNLNDVFTQKIEILAKDKSRAKCDSSKKVLDCFFSGDFESLERFCFVSLTHPAAKLAQMIYAKADKGVCFDAKMMFSSYVFDKIEKKHQNKSIIYDNNVIIVSKNGKDIMGIMPCFKYMNMKDCARANEDIKKAYDVLQRRDLEKFFIAYPRNEEFTKHIVVKKSHDEITSRLTLVPYSISHRIHCKQ